MNPAVLAEELADNPFHEHRRHTVEELLAALVAATVNQPTPCTSGHILSTCGRDTDGSLWFEHAPVAYWVRGIPHIANPHEHHLDDGTLPTNPSILWHPDTLTPDGPVTHARIEADLAAHLLGQK